MQRKAGLLVAALALFALASASPAGAFNRQSPPEWGSHDAEDGRRGIVSVPVEFEVENVNRSEVPCGSDGRSYTVAGRLIAPRSALGARSPAATLYLHEFGWGRFFWKFPDGDLNYAREQARAGHASVVIDRLGYDRSSHPPGMDTCLGAQADIAHQIVEQLGDGDYKSRGREPVQFRRVALAGYSGGGAIAELAAYSFGGIDALLLFAYADQGFTTRSIQEASEQGQACAAGGERAEPGEPGGYAYFAQTKSEWKSFMFASAKRSVRDAAAKRRNRDPCGDTNSFNSTVLSNNLRIGEIDVPVRLLYGTRDAIYEQPEAGRQQRDMFTGSDDVTLRFFEQTGHALTVEEAGPEVRRSASRWLRKRGF